MVRSLSKPVLLPGISHFRLKRTDAQSHDVSISDTRYLDTADSEPNETVTRMDTMACLSRHLDSQRGPQMSEVKRRSLQCSWDNLAPSRTRRKLARTDTPHPADLESLAHERLSSL